MSIPTMRIGGFQKLSFIDYPDTIASVVFVQGCNWRCPWCHNPTLVHPEQYGPLIPEQEVLGYLRTRVSLVEGVVISGGEPTLQPDLESFIRSLRAMGYRIKLDTSGSRPEVLERLIDEGLIDFAAMDIKGGPHSYAMLAGTAVDLGAIQRSINLIETSGIAHQFRTTWVPHLHSEADRESILSMLRHPESHQFQDFVDSRALLN